MIDSIRKRICVIGAPIDAITWKDTISRISRWANNRESRVVCICNAHSVVTSRQDIEFAHIIDTADIATPDGAPVAWLLRRLGAKEQQRINGPDLMLKYCAHAESTGQGVYLYGSTQSTLDRLFNTLTKQFPRLRVVGMHSPPFRSLSTEEDYAAIKSINDSGANVVWVSLGCPKQEKWMNQHRGKVHAVMVGVGAAFEYHAGTIQRAPLWMQERGLEWLHRLASEPKRLWRRYLFTNSLFIWFAIQQLLMQKFK